MRQGYYLMIKESIQEDVTTINNCAPSIEAPQYIT